MGLWTRSSTSTESESFMNLLVDALAALIALAALFLIPFIRVWAA
jgi:hypothetical protein